MFEVTFRVIVVLLVFILFLNIFIHAFLEQ